MRKTYAIAVILIIAFALVAQAEPADRGMFFQDCVEKKIAQCQRKGELATSERKNVRAAGVRARNQMIFFQNNKELLVDEMIQQGVPMNRSKVEFFLIKTYSDQTRLVNNAEAIIESYTPTPADLSNFANSDLLTTGMYGPEGEGSSGYRLPDSLMGKAETSPPVVK